MKKFIGWTVATILAGGLIFKDEIIKHYKIKKINKVCLEIKDVMGRIAPIVKLVKEKYGERSSEYRLFYYDAHKIWGYHSTIGIPGICRNPEDYVTPSKLNIFKYELDSMVIELEEKGRGLLGQ